MRCDDIDLLTYRGTLRCFAYHSFVQHSRPTCMVSVTLSIIHCGADADLLRASAKIIIHFEYYAHFVQMLENAYEFFVHFYSFAEKINCILFM